MADLIELCTKLESFDRIRTTLLEAKNIKEIHAPPRYEILMRELLTPHYGEVVLSNIYLYVSPYIPNDKIYFIYTDGTKRTVDFSN